MLACLTMIDDLAEVKSNLERLCKLKGWKIKYLNAPSLDVLLDYKNYIKRSLINFH